MHTYIKGLALFLIFFAGSSCKDTTVTPSDKTPFTLSDIRTADFWQVYATTPELVEVRVHHPEGPAAIESVNVGVLDNENNLLATLPLFDDGGATTDSGDLIAGDGVYRNRIKPSTLVSTGGDYILRFMAVDKEGQSALMLEKKIIMGTNRRPQIHAVFASSLFPSGFFADTLAVIVFDPDSTSEVDAVILQIIKPGNLPVTYTDKAWEQAGGDSLFTLGIDSSFGAGRTGDYLLSFKARDKFGAVSDTLLRPVYIANKAGYISQITMPNEITKPASGNKQIFITAKVGDPQSIADVDSVYFYSQKPDGSLSNGGRPFVMVDNGKPFNINNSFYEAGDKVAGDGVYSLTSLLDPGAATGTFVFSFFMRDKVGNLSVVARDSINIK